MESPHWDDEQICLQLLGAISHSSPCSSLKSVWPPKAARQSLFCSGPSPLARHSPHPLRDSYASGAISTSIDNMAMAFGRLSVMVQRTEARSSSARAPLAPQRHPAPPNAPPDSSMSLIVRGLNGPLVFVLSEIYHPHSESSILGSSNFPQSRTLSNYISCTCSPWITCKK